MIGRSPYWSGENGGGEDRPIIKEILTIKAVHEPRMQAAERKDRRDQDVCNWGRLLILGPKGDSWLAARATKVIILSRESVIISVVCQIISPLKGGHRANELGN